MDDIEEKRLIIAVVAMHAILTGIDDEYSQADIAEESMDMADTMIREILKRKKKFDDFA